VGVLACLVLLASGAGSFAIGVVACVLFAVYWAIEPGGCAGYAGPSTGANRSVESGVWPP
jgi:MFS transporter, OFA family, oxalate/formate antiporter